ncbi:putative Zinc finger, BED-type [Corchorus olitorius]|uniref:Zinc finger, BED-type n=1 Tax=Corchorus olitorius TaxID=93759 RepID=A0A1R3FVD8_9ROSI|nr:putative Zinc finger, BED-type [Corchorus olitorius]
MKLDSFLMQIIIEEESNSQPDSHANPSGASYAPTPTNSTSSSQNETVLSSRTIRGKTDMAWAYVSETVAMDGKRFYTCTFCAKFFKGGGIHRMKMHLAGTPNSSAVVGASSVANKRYHGSGRGIASCFPSGTSPGSQPTIKTALQSKERWGMDRFCHSPHIKNGLLAILGNPDIVQTSANLVSEIAFFQDRIGSFGQKLAINTYKTSKPDVSQDQNAHEDVGLDFSYFDVERVSGSNHADNGA